MTITHINSIPPRNGIHPLRVEGNKDSYLATAFFACDGRVEEIGIRLDFGKAILFPQDFIDSEITISDDDRQYFFDRIAAIVSGNKAVDPVRRAAFDLLGAWDRFDNLDTAKGVAMPMESTRRTRAEERFKRIVRKARELEEAARKNADVS